MNNVGRGEISVFGEEGLKYDNTVFKGNGIKCDLGCLQPPVVTRFMKIAFLCLPVGSHFSSIITYNSFLFFRLFYSG